MYHLCKIASYFMSKSEKNFFGCFFTQNIVTSVPLKTIPTAGNNIFMTIDCTNLNIEENYIGVQNTNVK